MINRNSLGFLGQFYYSLKNKIKRIYQNSKFYEKKISKTFDNDFQYKPSPHLLSSIIKYQNKKYRIEDFAVNSFWQSKMNAKDYEKLNNFFWFFSLDLKSSKEATRLVVKNWLKNNGKFNNKSWQFDITSKRIIAWLSNHQLTYQDSDKEYRLMFDHMIQKQTNHLLNEIKTSNDFENKLIGCSAIILTGLAYKNEKNYLEIGLGILKKIIRSSVDNQGFTKSRNIKQLVFYLKYLIVIREWFKESQNTIPDYIDETVFYLGSSYTFIWKNIGKDIFFNGNYQSENHDFDQYLKRFSYTFKNEMNELGGYVILKNKQVILAMDVGSSPSKNFSMDYQYGALSFEVFSNQKKLITNSGYFSDKNNKLNKLSKSTALHSTLVLEDFSSCSSKKINNNFVVEKGLKVLKKNIVFEKNYWKIMGSHNGYLKKFGTIHERETEFYPEQNKFVGKDKMLRKNSKKAIKFDIRFHLYPDAKVMKTQDNKSILIQLGDQGWKFSCDNLDINIDNSLYLGNKNSYKDNQNIFISGMNKENEQIIKWEIIKL